MQPLVFEVAHTPGDGVRTLGFCAAILLVVGGIALAMAKGSLLPLSATAIASACLVWLFRTQPMTQHTEYFVIDDHGLRYVHTLGDSGRVSKYAWSEIRSVSMKLASMGEDVQGLSVATNRPNLGGVPVLLPIFSESDCIAAYSAAEKQLEIRHAATRDDA